MFNTNKHTAFLKECLKKILQSSLSIVLTTKTTVDGLNFDIMTAKIKFKSSKKLITKIYKVNLQQPLIFQGGPAGEVVIILPSTHAVMVLPALKPKICPAAGQVYCQRVVVMIPKFLSANLVSSFLSKHNGSTGKIVFSYKYILEIFSKLSRLNNVGWLVLLKKN
jgi:hypothetical protein